MASSSADVPYNHPTENVLFGQNVIEKITDTCLGQDGKRYYQVKWRESWEPEERLMTACESALQAFWKEYYANVEKEIRKQVITASKGPLSQDQSNDEHNQIVATSIEPPTMTTISPPKVLHTPIETVDANTGATSTTRTNVVESFPEQSSTVAYYAVQDNIEINSDNPSAPMQQTTTSENKITTPIPEQLTKDLKDIIEQQTVDEVEVAEQAEILTQIINSTPSMTENKWTDKDLTANRRTLTTITADTLNTKSVAGPDANSKFHCDICLKTFVSKRNVQRHMLSHTGEKPWMCEYCFKRFRQKPHLEQHVNIHKGIKNAVCSICGKAFNHRSNLVTHMATHSNARPHACEMCGETFKLKHTLAKHMMVHSKLDVNKRHQCKECKRSFRDKSYLTEHESIHLKEKPYQCDICSKSFSFKRRYQMHLEVHRASDGGDEYVCHLCPKKFKAKGYLQKHLERHENKRRKRKRKREEAAAAAAAAAAGFDLNAEGAKDILINTSGVHDEDEDEDDIDDQDDSMGDEDVEMSITEIDVKGELEDGETKTGSTLVTDENDVNSQIIQIEGGDDDDANMVVTSMLPMSSLNMEDPATYVALAQLTQAAIESAPMDESGNVILMSYADIQKSMQEMQQQHHSSHHHNEEHHQQQQSDHTVDLSLHNIQIAQQQHHEESSNLVAVQDAQTVVDESTGEYVHINASGEVITTIASQVVELDNSTS